MEFLFKNGRLLIKKKKIEDFKLMRKISTLVVINFNIFLVDISIFIRRILQLKSLQHSQTKLYKYGVQNLTKIQHS
jgi:hypothetical protein